jgi:hypothetical protein
MTNPKGLFKLLSEPAGGVSLQEDPDDQEGPTGPPEAGRARRPPVPKETRPAGLHVGAIHCARRAADASQGD